MLTGGKPNDNGGRGLFYEPTVLVDVDHEMDCMREETFGPTLPVMKVRDAAEAIEKANDSRFGFVGQRLDARQDQGDGAGPADEHRNSQHQQRAHGHLPVPGPDGGLEGVGRRFAFRGCRGNPKVLPDQKHCGRTDCHEEGADLVPIQPHQRQDRVGGGQVPRSSGLAAPTRSLILTEPVHTSLCPEIDE